MIKQVKLDDFIRENTKIETVSIKIKSIKSKKVIQPPFSPYEGNSPDIFICYSHKNKTVIYEELKWYYDLGYKTWYDEGISPTTHWLSILPQKIFNSKLFVIYLSIYSIKSEIIRRELTYASTHNKTILPIFLENLKLPEDFDFILGPIQGIMKYNMEESRYRAKIIKTLRDIL